MSEERLSMYLSYLLRHHPEERSLEMDRHGWVAVDDLIAGVNEDGRYHLTGERLAAIVAHDRKGRYRLSSDGERIKACQGHSIPWVEPELDYTAPPAILYHGTTWDACGQILQSGAVSKMGRHAVHLTAVEARAWQSARRWKKRAVVLQIDAKGMQEQGAVFGVTENDVWCTETIPIAFLSAILGEDGHGGSKEIPRDKFRR